MNVGQSRKMYMNFPQKAVLERLTKYLVFLELNSPIINRLNGILSGFKSHSSYSSVGFQWEDTSWNIYYILLHSFALLLFLSLMHLVAVKFWPQSNELCDDLSTNFIFHHSDLSLIAATWNARTVIYRVVTCIKPLKSPFISLKKSSVLIS